MRSVSERMRKQGEPIDMSQRPVYPEHVAQMSQAYERAGSVGAAQRRAALVTANMTAGRAGEVAWLHDNSLAWDHHFKCMFADSMQQKTSKSKVIALVVGRTRHNCFFDAMG